MAVDATAVLLEGPWRHRFVAANGARFHVAEAGEGPLVVLLHGFPQTWWCWRAQIPALADAGYRVAAMDLRGYGASDKPPRGYDTLTLAADVAAVVRSLGESTATVIGHDWGAWIAWSMPSLEPAVTRAVAAISMGHPLRVRTAHLSWAQRRASRHVWSFQLPFRPERWLVRPGTVEQLLRSWGGGGDSARDWPPQPVADHYADAMRIPFVAHSAMEYYRWVVRSQPRRDGRTFRAAVNRTIDVPVLQLHGDADPVILPASARGSQRWAEALRYVEVSGGHFLPEQQPDVVTAQLLAWLADVDPVAAPA